MHGTLDRSLWSPFRDRQLAELIEKKYSASQAAIELGITRNACIGRAYRLDLQFKSEGIRSTYWKERQRPEGSDPLVVTRINRRPTIKSNPLPAMEPEPDALMLTVNRYIEGGKGVLKNKSCRFVVTTDHPMLYCGKDKAGGFSYCAYHCRVVYQPPQARNREPRPR
jgi:GcrA cell cycle regulator